VTITKRLPYGYFKSPCVCRNSRRGTAGISNTPAPQIKMGYFFSSLPRAAAIQCRSQRPGMPSKRVAQARDQIRELVGELRLTPTAEGY
jgi:hypothetical protein